MRVLPKFALHGCSVVGQAEVSRMAAFPASIADGASSSLRPSLRRFHILRNGWNRNPQLWDMGLCALRASPMGNISLDQSHSDATAKAVMQFPAQTEFQSRVDRGGHSDRSTRTSSLRTWLPCFNPLLIGADIRTKRTTLRRTPQ